MGKGKKYLDSVFSELHALERLLGKIDEDEAGTLVWMAGLTAGAIAEGRVVFTCGNGGSAADAQHIAGELVGRFRRKLSGYKAIALTTNSSVVTALANDFSYEEIFSKQLESMAQPGDVLLSLSTSGESPNILRAVEYANEHGIESLAFVGKKGGRLAEIASTAIVVPHDDFARIQEVHMVLGHIFCGLVEEMVQTGDETA